MKKLSKKLLALLLVFAMLIPTGAIAVTTTAAGSYITELATSHVAYRGGNDLYYEDVATAISLLTNNGYSAVDYDLNQGVFGDFIYMGYRLGSNSNSAIRDIKIYKGSNPPSYINETVNGSTCTYYPVLDVEGYAYDLNANANSGSPIYAYYTKDAAAGGPITSIYFSTSSAGANVTYFNSTSAANLNYKSGLVNSDAIYMSYTYDANTQPSVPTGPQFPAGYNFKEDSYSFPNLDETISWNYYVSAFGTIRGLVLYNRHESGANHGHCFGMAQSTASILKQAPSTTSFDNNNNLRTLSPNDYSSEIEMDLRSYIKYSHIYQFSDSVSNMRNTNKGYDTVYNAVKKYVKYGGSPVLIDMWANFGGHTVYAIGIEGDDIIVNDSNEPGNQTKITKTENGWSYFGGGWYWDSNNGDTINFVYATTSLYGAILDDLDKFFSNHKLLVKGKTSLSYSTTSEMDEILETSLNNELDNEYRYYWLDDNVDTITVSNPTESDEIISVSSEDLGFEVGLSSEASACFKMKENTESNVTVSTKSDENIDLTVMMTNDENELVSVSLIGTANGDEVVASETEDGIQVTGLNDITVTYETPDGTAETKADVTDGSTVNITVNDDKNTVETDWQDKEETETDEECKHSDANHDGICDACSEDFTKGCSCNCHGNAFMQFLHKIVTFLRKLFGMTQYQYCNCGKAHW